MIKKHTPRILQFLDGWLLKNHPLIWRTRIHWVLFWTIVVHVLLYGLYWLVPMTTANMPSRIGVSNVRISVLVLAGFSLLIWFLSINRFGFKGKDLKSVFIQYSLCWIGVAAIGFSVWNANKLFDQKVAGLVEYSDLYGDLYDAVSFKKQLDYNKYVHLKERYQIDYFLSEDGFKKSERYYADQAFSNFIKLAKGKMGVIDDAVQAGAWFSLKGDYSKLQGIIVFSLIGFPLLVFLFSYGGVLFFILVGFLHFVLYGVLYELLYVDGMSEYFVYLSLLLTGVGLVLFKNRMFWNRLLLFIITTIPVSFVLYYLDIRTSFYMQHLYLQHIPAPEFTLTLLVLFVTALCFTLYAQKTNQPQIA